MIYVSGDMFSSKLNFLIMYFLIFEIIYLATAEIAKLIGKVERSGYTLTPLDLHYSGGRIKLSIGLAKGKKQHDKRAVTKEKDWQREQQRLIRQKN